MTVPLQLEAGAGELRAFEGDKVRLWSPKAAAPGARVLATLDQQQLRVKVHRCVREGEGFAIDGKLLDATRVLRELLARKLAG